MKRVLLSSVKSAVRATLHARFEGFVRADRGQDWPWWAVVLAGVKIRFVVTVCVRSPATQKQLRGNR
jgi:hypothetical protein